MDDLFLCLNIGRLNIKNRHPNIGIKDIFECFMMVLNYRTAVLKPLKPEGLSALIQQIDSLKPS